MILVCDLGWEPLELQVQEKCGDGKKNCHSVDLILEVGIGHCLWSSEVPRHVRVKASPLTSSTTLGIPRSLRGRDLSNRNVPALPSVSGHG